MANSTVTAPPSIQERLGKSLAAGAASGALTLIDPAKLRPSTKAAFHIGTGVLAGGLGWLATGPGEDAKSGRILRSSIGLGLAAFSIASSKFGFLVDAKIHQALLHRGIDNPRPVMAVGAGLLTAAVALLEPAVNNPHPNGILKDNDGQ